MQEIKHIIAKTIDSVKSKLNPKKLEGCFELFGYDFMCDSDLTVWLIECNTNPCLDESSAILRRILPRLLDDMFKLTIDKIFPSPNELLLDELQQLKKNHCQRKPPLPAYLINRNPETRKFNKPAGAPFEQQAGLEEYRPTEVDREIKRIEALIEKEKLSKFELDPYLNSENLWQPIMTIDQAKPRQKLNMKVNHRVIRAES